MRQVLTEVLPAGIASVRGGLDVRAEGIFDAFGCAVSDQRMVRPCMLFSLRVSGSRILI